MFHLCILYCLLENKDGCWFGSVSDIDTDTDKDIEIERLPVCILHWMHTKHTLSHAAEKKRGNSGKGRLQP